MYAREEYYEHLAVDYRGSQSICVTVRNGDKVLLGAGLIIRPFGHLKRRFKAQTNQFVLGVHYQTRIAF